MIAGDQWSPPYDDPLNVVLDAIADTGQVLRAVETETLVLVTEAYFRGASWAEIARRLDRTKQSVHQRYQSRVHSRRTQELLLDDLTDAFRRARQLSRREPVDAEVVGAEVVVSRALLREWANRALPPGLRDRIGSLSDLRKD
jgi:predicted ATPase